MAGKRPASPAAAEQQPTKKTKTKTKTKRGVKTASPEPSLPQNSWDRLSKVWLTARALDEIDRRRPASKPQHPPGPDPALLALPVEDLRALKRFSSYGGPDLSDLCGYPDSWWEDHPPPVAVPRVTTANVSAAYDRNFEQALADNGVGAAAADDDDDPVAERPRNWDSIMQRMARRRSSLASDKLRPGRLRQVQAHRSLASRGANAANTVFPTLRGDNSAILHVEDRAFDNLEPFIEDEPVPARPPSKKSGRAGTGSSQDPERDLGLDHPIDAVSDARLAQFLRIGSAGDWIGDRPETTGPPCRGTRGEGNAPPAIVRRGDNSRQQRLRRHRNIP
ncbi:hypothetical protein VTN77DRAFT_6613 [Rasamsonia byssochlamydoides]|uniref:uncharacterized protein n=1 Tax=Rasamsonia byssochlamydoides TaxID=89139 RepID=UPI00374420FE